MSCENQLSLTDSKSYQPLSSTADFGVIRIDQYNDFYKLQAVIDSISCVSKTPNLVFENNGKLDSLEVTSDCSRPIEITSFRTRNLITIHNDKIVYGIDLLSLDILETKVLKHLYNYGESPAYSESPEQFHIRISYREHHLRKLPELLGRLKALYLDHKDFAKCKIVFRQHIFPPPTPPEK